MKQNIHIQLVGNRVILATPSGAMPAWLAGKYPEVVERLMGVLNAGALCLMLRSQGIPARIVVGYRPDVWISLSAVPDAMRSRAGLALAARLKPGVSLAQAQADTDMIAAQLEKQFPESQILQGLAQALRQGSKEI